MPTVVVIPGTGVREPAYREMLNAVKRRLEPSRPHYKVVECSWFQKYGTPPPPYKSVPERMISRAVGNVGVTDALLVWQCLYLDPLAELRDFAEFSVGSANPTNAVLLAERIRLAAPPESLAEFGMDNLWKEARNLILGSEVTRAAISRGTSRPDGIRLVVARALVAQLISRAIDLSKIIPDGLQRDLWVDILRRNMGTDITAGSRAVPFILKPAVRALNRYLLRPLGETLSPIAGDIIFYQVRGSGIRDFISKVISEAAPPVFVLAHSLGGIAVIDTLILNPALKVEAVVTFGSQAPFFFEINSLASLEEGQPLPVHFTPTWLNICDPNDLLSFRAQPAFPNDHRVIDEQLDSGQPPLAAHSSYLGSNAFWNLVWSVFR
jgi:hypothetical protein